MADPRRDLPRVINVAMIVAIGGFTLMNIALLAVLPYQQIRNTSVVAVVSHDLLSFYPLHLYAFTDLLLRNLA